MLTQEVERLSLELDKNVETLNKVQMEKKHLVDQQQRDMSSKSSARQTPVAKKEDNDTFGSYAKKLSKKL